MRHIKFSRLLVISAFLLLVAPVQAQRFARVINTVAELVASNPNNADTNVLVLGYSTVSDQGGGPFAWVSGNASATNLGTVFASTYPGASGRWKRQYSGALNVRWFGAAGTGANQTTQIKNAYDTIDKSAGGDLFFPPGNYTFNLEVTNRNIGLVFESFIREDSGSPVIVSNIVQAADVTKPIITIGNGIDSAKGCRVVGGTFIGNGSSGVLLRLAGGAYECLVRAGGYYNAKTNIWIQGHGSQPCALNRFQDVSSLCANVDDSRSLYISAPASGTGYTTTSSFVDCHFNSQASGANTYVGQIDATDMELTATRFDGLQFSPLRVSYNTGLTNAASPVIYNANTIFDGSSGSVSLYVDFATTARISSVLQGGYAFNGRADFNGTVLLEEKCQSTVVANGQYTLPNVNGRASFDRVGSTTNRAWNTLEANDTDPTIFQLSATNGTMELLGRTNISLATGDGSYTNKLVILEPGMLSITNSWPSVSSLKIYGAGSGVYSDTNAPTVRIFTSSQTNTVRSALHLDSYQQTPAFPISLDFGLMNSTNGAYTSRILHFANVNTNRGSWLLLQTHSTAINTWSDGLKISPDGGVQMGGTNDNADAILDLQSTTRAFGAPALATADRDALLSPRNGFQIYNSTLNKMQFREAGAWNSLGTVTSVALAVPSVFTISGSPITTSGTLTLGLNGSSSTEFLRRDGTWAVPPGTSTAGTVTNFSVGPWTNLMSASTTTTYPTLTAVDPGAHRVYGWDDTDNAPVMMLFDPGSATYDHATHTWTFSGGAGGSATNAYSKIQEEGVGLTARTNLNFIGAAITATDNSGADRTDVTLAQSPADSTNVVGTGRTISTTAPLTGGGDLSANRTLALTISPGGATTAVGTTRAINTTTGVKGGGNLSADLTLEQDIPGLTESTSTTPASDFVAVYLTGGATHRKVKLENLLGGQGMDTTYHSKSLAINGATTILRMTPAINMSAFGATLRGVCVVKTAANVFMGNFEFYLSARRVDASGGVDGSGRLEFKEFALIDTNELNDNGGTYAGVTSCDVSVANIDLLGATSVTIYFQTSVFGPGTITYL